MRLTTVAIVSTLLLCANFSMAAKPVNYDEAKVPEYKLPELMVDLSGKPVRTADDWKGRRAEILELFREHMHGHAPGKPAELWFEVEKVNKNALGGLAVMKEVVVHFAKDPGGPSMRMLVFLPGDAKGPVPIFLTLNFLGNQSIQADPNITLCDSWMRPFKKVGVVNNRATEAGRGIAKPRWPVEKIIDRGYALATIYYGDIDPDFDDGFQNGVHPLFYREGQTCPEANGWGSIAAWAWGLSRAMDYLETDADIDAKRVAVMGHSRLGKTSLWAGARDGRFALVISNNSGCGGAALSRRAFGETLEIVSKNFPHWFCDNFNKYSNNENSLPIDQHMLVALMAPRPVYIASAVGDRWADPKGEFLSGFHASKVYQLLGKPGIVAKEMPAVNQPADKGTIGYHVRSGNHDVTDFDWNQYLNFADRFLKK
jgi:(4-O-methyl)-D-glucuronate---lignin esterase